MTHTAAVVLIMNAAVWVALMEITAARARGAAATGDINPATVFRAYTAPMIFFALMAGLSFVGAAFLLIEIAR